MTQRQHETVFWRAADADPGALDGAVVAVAGYGNLGRSLALNLRDSGLEVIVGNRDDDYRARAAADGLPVCAIREAVARADVVVVVVPDEVIPACFRQDIAPALRAGAALCFASGYVLAYDLVAPPDTVDVLLLAPRMLGEQVRRTYLEGGGFLSYVSVEHDASGAARARLLALALAAGALRRGAIELPARHEALLDLFIEQTVGPYLGSAFQLAFQLGVEAGLPPEALVCELYMSGEMARTMQTFAEVGFLASVKRHGMAAAYGGFLRSMDVDRDGMELRFRRTLEDITSGGFAQRLQAEHAAGYPTMAVIEAITAGDDPQTAAERRVRAALG